MAQWVPTNATAHAVYRLGTAFEAVSTGGPATRVVIVRGGIGSGRTGVLQAFYESIASRQRGTSYWPPSLAIVTDPFTDRDVVIPDEFSVAAGTRLPWLWWGLSGHDGCAALAANAQLERHTNGIAAAIKDLDDDKRRQVAYAIDGLLVLGGLVGIVAPEPPRRVRRLSQTGDPAGCWAVNRA